MTLKLSQLPALRSELHDLFAQIEVIEKKHADGLIPEGTDDHTKFYELLTEIKTKSQEERKLSDTIAERDFLVKGREQFGDAGASQGNQPVRDGRRAQTLGQMFLQSEGYTKAAESGLFEGQRVPEFQFQIKGMSMLDLLTKDNLLYSGSGDPGTGTGDPTVMMEPFESRTRLAGIMPILRHPNTFLDVVPRLPTDDEILEWVKESSFTNGATMIGEATAITGTTGLKPSSTMAFTVETSFVRDVAHWMVVTNKMLRNKSAIRGMIDRNLRLGLDLVIEQQILSGDGTGNNLLGLLDSGTGIQLRAQGGDSIPDAIRRAITMVRVTGFAQPSDLFMHPLDWETVDLLRDEAGGSADTGTYIWGGPVRQGQATMWGIPVRQTVNIPQGTVLLGDMSQCTLFDRQRTNITVGRVDNQLIRNIQTVLAEAALAFVCFRPDAFCQITGIS